ncbi:hypothetical protein MX629_12370 [Carnobacterium divergens]|uniref:Uncharacterized protein n=1 Tax=Carnobacterium divergens TaxID=2748 RepID=A0AAW8RG87_CARDV|nr:hypothetical protein [Carnobacterium divergens]MDT1959228.1 hypothetical protein [Carnobacterium divergens]MDT1975116.1 hypothetical protein [Carnobacterium divergens]
MSTENTTEVLAKAIDETKDVVQTDKEEVTFKIQGENVTFQIINKVASNDTN